MSHADLLATGSELLFREGYCLDRQQWQDWLALFTEDCELWAPSWVGEHQQISDPQTEISLLYLAGRSRLQERVERAVSGASPASVPLPRTCHHVGNILLLDHEVGSMTLHSAWRVDYFHQKKTGAFFGHYEHRLVADGDAWRIARKRVTLMNDFIPTVMDVYHI
ncbi:aromatic-ring-hydroxylating dioxygenase subunit beta [Immundisolibacter sp.]|uniref:aromatic-ring-hydroxylating dioxygenase subunit beta n=3 Tax=Immundisolibacter sp. TaxID=1934948 RepID=UPI003569AA08